jgi:hypothetical protein
MRRLLAIALSAVLLLCAPAVAKEVTGATVCGGDGCKSMDGADEAMLQGGPPTDGPSRGEPFVRMEFRIAAGGETERVRNIFRPRSGQLLGDDGVTWLRPTDLATLRQQARRVTPFAASRLPASAPLTPPAPQPTPAPAASRPSSSSGDGASAWWPGLPAAVLALAVGTALARRVRMSHPPRQMPLQLGLKVPRRRS